jgi:chromosome partitioning protein
MPILTITSRKGGCGKTMLAVAIAGSLAEQGGDVALLDADPNATAHRWATQTHEDSAIKAYAEADAERLAVLLPSLAERHAALVVDTAGFGNQAAAVAIAAADLVLVPATPGEVYQPEITGNLSVTKNANRRTRNHVMSEKAESSRNAYATDFGYFATWHLANGHGFISLRAPPPSTGATAARKALG